MLPPLGKKCICFLPDYPTDFQENLLVGGAKSKKLPYSVTQVFLHQNEILYINLFFQPERCCEGHSMKQKEFGMFLFSLCHLVHLSTFIPPCPALSKTLNAILTWCIPKGQRRMLNRWIMGQVIEGECVWKCRDGHPKEDISSQTCYLCCSKYKAEF